MTSWKTLSIYKDIVLVSIIYAVLNNEYMLNSLQFNVLEKVPKKVKNLQYYLQHNIVALKTEIKQIQKCRKLDVLSKNLTSKK